jgi:hypothetical protein
MKVTEITSDNAEYFEDLIPEGYLENENLLWLGAIAGDGTACQCTFFQIQAGSTGQGPCFTKVS